MKKKTHMSPSVESLQREIAALKKEVSGQDATAEALFTTRARLEESEQRYRNLHDNIPLGLYRRTPGPKGKLVVVNPALVRMFGYASAMELNQVPVACLYDDPSQCEVFSEKLFTNREVIREQLKMRRRDGSPIWVSVTATVICDDSRQPVYFDGIMEDVTQARQMAEEAELQQQQLMQADKMISLGILVSGVAHEINNPNQFVVSHLAPLKKAWADALPILDRYREQHGEFKLGGTRYSITRNRIMRMFDNMQEGTRRISRIVNELRDYAREQPGTTKSKVNLNSVVRSALSLLANLTRKSTSAFYVTFAPDLPSIIGDYQRMEQVIINLVQNSCQALRGESRKVSIVTYERDADVVFQINDTGCGIAPENLARIKDPFFTTKRSLGGTGLGLSICQTIVQDHGGRLEFVSEEGEGTTVRLMLPAAKKTTMTPNVEGETI